MTTLGMAGLVLLWGVVILNLLVTLALVRRVNGLAQLLSNGGMAPLEKGKAAPEFRVQTLAGEEVGLATFAGRQPVFIFMHPACKHCREQVPALNELGPRAARSGVELYLVFGAEMVDAETFVKEYEIRLPVLVAPRPENPMTTDYRVSGTPYHVLLDARGRVVSAGLLDKEWEALTRRWQTGEPGVQASPALAS